MCSEPVREFHPRPVVENPFVGTPSHMVRTSRWRASDLTFGPRGRLAVTAIVFIVFFVGMSGAGWISPFGLWFFMGWFIMATMVLKTKATGWPSLLVPGRSAGLGAYSVMASSN